MVDLGQIERFALRFALGEPSQNGQEPGLQVVRECSRVAEPCDEFLDFLAVLGRDGALECVMVAIERPGQRRRRDVGFFDRVDRSAEFRRHDLGAVDRLRGATRHFERRLVGRMNGAEEIRGRETGLLDAPEQSVAIDEIVRSRRLGCGKPLNLGEIRALTGLGGSACARESVRAPIKNAQALSANRHNTLTAFSAPLLRFGGSRPWSGASRRAAGSAGYSRAG